MRCEVCSCVVRGKPFTAWCCIKKRNVQTVSFDEDENSVSYKVVIHTITDLF